MPKWKAALSVSVLCVALSLSIIATKSVKGYYIDIYDLLGQYFILLIIISYLSSSLSIGYSKTNIQTNISIVLLILSNFPLIIAPHALGFYSFGRGDTLTHIGYIQDIFNSGEILPGNIYPGGHIYSGYLAGIFDISFAEVVMFSPLVFFISYYSGIFVMFRDLVQSKRVTLSVLPVLFLPVYGHEVAMYVTSMLAFLLIPTYIFLTSRASGRLIIISLVFMAVITILHPLVAMFSIILTMGLGLLSKRTNRRLEIQRTISRTAVFIIVYFLWASSSDTFELGRFIFIKAFLVDSSGTLSKYSGILSTYSIEFLDIAQLGVLRYGLAAIFFGLSTLAFLYYKLIGNISSRKKVETSYNRSFDLFLITFPLLLLFSIYSFFSDIVLNFSRTSRYTLLVSLPISSILLYDLLNLVKEKCNIAYAVGLFTIFILICLILSTMTVYFSPLVKQTSAQVTHSEAEGVDWFYTYSDQEEPVAEIGISTSRFLSRRGISTEEYPRPPDHFGYQSNKSNITGGYIITTTMGRQLYPTLYPDYRSYWRFNPSDFARLRNDEDVDAIYSSGNFIVYHEK